MSTRDRGGGATHRHLRGVALGRHRRLRVLRRLLVEAQSRHVALDPGAVVLLVSVALARVQLGGLLLAPEDGDGVEAAVRALLAVEHGTAELVVVLQGFGAESVGGADPLGHPAGDHGLVAIGHGHLGAADLHAGFGVFAEVVAALALEIKRVSQTKKLASLTYWASFGQ